MDPVKTRNPNNLDYSPDGSSSGSVAAVAPGHVPVAIGAQTNGSVIRPASFCSVYGFKPSMRMISRTGVLRTSETLDQIGVFNRYLEDVAMVGDVISEFNPLDASSIRRSRPRMLEGVLNTETFATKLVWFKMPYFHQLSTDCREGMMAVINALGGWVEQLDVQKIVEGLVEA